MDEDTKTQRFSSSPTTLIVFVSCSKIQENDSAIPLLSMRGKDMKIYIYTKTVTQIFITALFIITKMWKQPNCTSIDE